MMLTTDYIIIVQIASGLLLSSFDAHYRSILTLTFSPTSQLLISSSEDSSTFVWSVTRLVDNDPRLMNALPEPWGALEGHSLAVVCVGVGKGGGPAGVEGRVWTGSMDGTVKVRRHRHQHERSRRRELTFDLTSLSRRSGP
jgi:pre-rRNA-processing protein IPI3